MHLADCAPTIVFGRRGGGSGSSACIHRSFSRELRRRRGAWTSLPLAALGVWPPYVIGAMIRATWLNGPAVRDRTGKGIGQQLREQVELAVADAIPPRWYYAFELFDDGRRQRAVEYLQRGETKRGAYAVLKRGAAPLSPLTDKVAFAARCRARGLSAIPVLLALEHGAVTFDGDGGLTLPHHDLFVKPNHGKGGRGAERWDYRHSGVYEDTRGRTMDESELLRHLRRLPFKEGLVVQPRRVNHAAIADLSNGALSTARIVTCRNEDGGFEPTNAVLRMAQGGNHVVDNFHAGGLAAKVDLASGRLGPATDLGLTPAVGWRDTHPNTGAPITGRVLPHWEATLELVTRAHAAFADRVVIGWDVGIMPDGPELVEGNGGPDLDIIQRTHREPLGEARLGRLLAFHLRQMP